MEAEGMFDKRIVFSGDLIEIFNHDVSTWRGEPRAITEVVRKDKKKRLLVRLHFAGGYEGLFFEDHQRPRPEAVLAQIEAAGGS